MKQHFSTAFAIFALLLASIAVVNSYNAWSSDEQPAKAAPLKEADIPLCPRPDAGWCRLEKIGVEVKPESQGPRTTDETRKLLSEPRKAQVAGRLAELEQHAHVISDDAAAFLIAKNYQPDTILKRHDGQDVTTEWCPLDARSAADCERYPVRNWSKSSADPARWCVQCIGDKPCEEYPPATEIKETAK